MITDQPAAAKRPPARAARETAEGSITEESLTHHVKRLLRARLSAMASGVLEPLIALLQQLLKRSGGAQDADIETDEDRPRPSRPRPGGGRDAVTRAQGGEDEAEAVAPQPKRRVRAFLIYFCVLLAGCMVGGALAYELLAKLLARQATESRRLELALSKQTKSAASNQKMLKDAESKRADAEKKFEEAKKKQMEAEKKLEAALADSKIAAEKQKKLNEAVRLLEQIRGTDRSGAAPRPSPASSSDGRARPLKSGDCTLAAGDVKALKDCVNEFNR